MKTRNLLFTIMVSVFSVSVNGQSTLALVESGTGGCDEFTDCAMNRLCLDIILTPGVSATVQAYNIWVKYPGTGLTYLLDSACITADGNDNDLDEAFSVYRVAGIQGSTHVPAGVPIPIHTICFTYETIEDLENQNVIVGGSMFEGAVPSTLTYNLPPSNEGNLPEFPFLMNEETISCIDPLSAQLLSFQALKREGTGVLNWTTVAEQNHAGFQIERSGDATHFDIIGYVAAANSSHINYYEFIDERPLNGVNYYRLNYHHQGEYSQYSPIRSLLFGDHGLVVRVWPNPATDMLFVDVHSSAETIPEVRLLSMSGQEVSVRRFVVGEFRERFDLEGLAAGVYNLVVESNLGLHVEKVVIMD